MGAITGMLGLNGGIGGTGFSTNNPVTGGQIQQSLQGVQTGMTSQQQLLQALQNQQGLQNQSNVYGQLQNVVAGQGPNPAQAMLNQQTGQNVANQAALMAGQRGASSNVGLMARQAAQQGAATQQQAVGQGATLQAQQSLGALGQAGALANQQAQQQIGQTNQNVAAAQNLYGQQVGAQNAYNQQQAGLAQSQMGMTGGLLGGALSGLGTYMGLSSLAGGAAGATAGSGLAGSAGLGSTLLVAAKGGDVSKLPGISSPKSHFAKAALSMAKGGNVPAMVAPGEVYLTPKDVQKVKSGASPLKVGEKIKGKAPVPGAVNDYRNDVVQKDLKSGGIIVPNKETKSENPERNSRDFVNKVLAKRHRK